MQVHAYGSTMFTGILFTMENSTQLIQKCKYEPLIPWQNPNVEVNPSKIPLNRYLLILVRNDNEFTVFTVRHSRTNSKSTFSGVKRKQDNLLLTQILHLQFSFTLYKNLHTNAKPYLSQPDHIFLVLLFHLLHWNLLLHLGLWCLQRNKVDFMLLVLPKLSNSTCRPL